jgi:hypothetical protein
VNHKDTKAQSDPKIDLWDWHQSRLNWRPLFRGKPKLIGSLATREHKDHREFLMIALGDLCDLGVRKRVEENRQQSTSRKVAKAAKANRIITAPGSTLRSLRYLLL